MPFDLATAKPVAQFDLSTAKPVQSDVASSPGQPDSFLRQQGLGLRHTLEGLGSVLTAPSDMLSGPIDYGLGKLGVPPQYRLGSSTQALSDALTKAGLPQVQNQNEATVGSIGRAIASVPGYVLTGGMLAGSGAPVAAGVGQAMASSPMTQVASAAGGAAGSETARRAGYGPIGQIVGGLAGSAIPALASAAMVRPEISTDPADIARAQALSDRQAAAKVLKDNNVPVYRYQASDSGTLKNAQAAADQLPFSGAKGSITEQQKAFNRALLSLTGANADAATSSVMGKLQKDLGGTLNQIEARNSVSFDTELAKDLSGIVGDARLGLNDQQYGIIQRQLQNIAQKASDGSTISGKAFAGIKQGLDDLSIGADQQVGSIARDIRDSLQDALRRSLPKEEAAAYADTLGKYRIMKQLEGAIDKQGLGNISPSRLVNILGQKSNRAQSIYGKGDQSLVKLAQAGAQILPETVPNSGTPQRLLYGALLGGSYFNPMLAAKVAGVGATAARGLRALPVQTKALPQLGYLPEYGAANFIGGANALAEQQRRNVLGQ